MGEDWDEQETGEDKEQPCKGDAAEAKSTTETGALTLEKTVEAFKDDPVVPNVHEAALRKYVVFCRNRTADLYRTFFALVGDRDLSWCNDAVYCPSFAACAPFAGQKYARMVSGGTNRSKQMHGLVRYDYQCHIIEECRKGGKQHGLRVVCTEMGHVWLRLYKNGERLAQLVLNGDMSVQSKIDDGGLRGLKEHLHLIRACFRP